MAAFLWVGLGGALGAMLRYAIGLIPVPGDFPLLTLCINFLGAVAIGCIAEVAGTQRFSANSILFWKTGVCGGFTTFSTFSLEAVTLFQAGKWGMGGAYTILSVAGCFGGILLGQMLGRKIFAA